MVSRLIPCSARPSLCGCGLRSRSCRMGRAGRYRRDLTNGSQHRRGIVPVHRWEDLMAEKYTPEERAKMRAQAEAEANFAHMDIHKQIAVLSMQVIDIEARLKAAGL